MRAVRRKLVPGSIPAVLALILAAAGLPAQEVGQANAGAAVPESEWTFGTAPVVDLWFHGLAVVGFGGFGPMLLYSPRYANRVAADKRAASLVTELDRLADRLRGSLRADSAFEVLHFLPVHFADAGRSEALAAIRVALGGEARLGATRNPRTRYGAAVVAAVLNTPLQRGVTLEFLDALEDEWRGFLTPRWAQELEASGAEVQALRERWHADYAPALAPYLDRFGVGGGKVLVSRPLGAEGRFFDADPEDPWDNVVVIGLAQGNVDAALSSLVRELCFPAVRAAFQTLEKGVEDRVEASRLSDRAGTRCGELLLEERAPELLSAYRATFPASRSQGGWGAAGGPSSTEAALEQALKRAVSLDLDAGPSPNGAPGPAGR